jgi:hypothetical protein
VIEAALSALAIVAIVVGSLAIGAAFQRAADRRERMGDEWLARQRREG